MFFSFFSFSGPCEILSLVNEYFNRESNRQFVSIEPHFVDACFVYELRWSARARARSYIHGKTIRIVGVSFIAPQDLLLLIGKIETTSENRRDPSIFSKQMPPNHFEG